MGALAASRCSSALLKMTSASSHSPEPTLIGDVGHGVVVLSRLMWPMALTAVRMSRFLREYVVGHDVVGHLRRGHQVHLEQAASLRTSSRKDVLHEDVGCAA